MRPRVVIQNMVSLDGRIDGFSPDLGSYRKMAARWEADIHLVGSETLAAAIAHEGIPEETDESFEPLPIDPHDKRPLLVVPDAEGELNHWHVLRESGLWRDILVLVSPMTSEIYLDYLQLRNIPTLLTVDMASDGEYADYGVVLEKLAECYGAKTVLVESGGTLNGLLLRKGLVDEVGMIIQPAMVGGMSQHSIYRAPDLPAGTPGVPLKLVEVERLEDDLLWLHYTVVK